MRLLVLESILSFARAILGRKFLSTQTLIVRKLNRTVQDEFFHVRQAEAYLKGRWDIWDPKITTPPGLCVRSASQSFFSCNSLQKADRLGLDTLFLVY